MREIELTLLPAEALDSAVIKQKVLQKTEWPADDLAEIIPLRRSIDARGRRPLVRMRVAAYHRKDNYDPEPRLLDQLQRVDEKEEVIIVGAGPAGYFAALELIELALNQ